MQKKINFGSRDVVAKMDLNADENISSASKENEPQNILLQKENISDSSSICSRFVSTVATTNTKHTQPGIETCLNGGIKAGKISNAIIYMLAKDNLPLYTVEKEGFKNLMKVTVPLYKIPGRSKMTNMVDEKYNILSYKMKEIIKNVTNISLRTDVWTDTLNTRSFLGLTCHFIHGNDLKSVSISVTELNQSHTSNYLESVLKSLCDTWGINDHKIVAIVTDNVANIKKAVIKAFGKTKHLPCFGHTINLVAAKPFDSSTDIKEFVTQIKDIVRYFKHSMAASDELRKCQDMRQAPLKLIQSSARNCPDLITILKPLESITRELSGAKYVTASKVIPIVYCLRKEINSVQTKSPSGEGTKKLLLEEISRRFGSIEQVTSLAISTVLDPRFKKIYFEDKIACFYAVTKIMNTLSEIKDDKALFEEDEVPDEVDAPGKEAASLWRHHDTLI
ncbi:unnamed protein product [Psylliodes chrysocephalus]|uniref:Zinc finger BED domain-containing protein 1-like n=1 Tax=Psylliodes chrysocephalus TaxID=3402493 RepID=A0A9P0D1T0_9CUCU|nr:unnamed protein product [Psylliodes chrysocephala]